MLRHLSLSARLTRLLVLLSVVALATLTAYADVASTTDDPAGYISVDAGTVDRSLIFTGADFPAGSSIRDVNISIRFIKTAGTCANPVGGPPYNDEILFRMTFDNAASAVPSGVPATGTFLPTGPGTMSDFDGEDPLGTWTLTVGDDANRDPLCYDWSTLTIDADPPPPNLSLSKSADVSDPLPGERTTFTVVLHNSGAGDATNAVVSDTLPSGLTFAGPVTLDPPGSGIVGTPPLLASGLTITAGERITLTFPVTVNTGLAVGTLITNTASVTSTEVSTPSVGSARLSVLNAPPLADADAFDVQEDSIGNALDVLDGDSDANGDVLNIDAVGATDHGGTALNGGTVVTYTPATDFFGTEVFTYSVADGNGGYATATVTVTVQNENDPPTADDDAFDVTEDSVDNPLDVLSGDDDVDGDVLSIDAVGATDQGGTALNGGTVVTYTPAADFFGTEVFTYTVTDGNGGYATATVTVNVQNENDPPTADDDAYVTPFEVALVVTDAMGVLSNDGDVDGDVLTAGTAIGPSHGALDLRPDGSFVYTPTAGFFGVDAFAYQANDGLVDSNVATATITVLAPTEVDLALRKTVDEALPGEEDQIVYTLRVTNNGLIAATGVNVSDTLPVGVSYADHGGTGTLVGGMWMVGVVDSGATSTLRITATVDMGTAGTTITNTASIAAADQPDPFPSNDTAEAVIRVNSAPTISDIPDQTIHVGQTLGPLYFNVGDAETDPDNLSVWASSLNTTLVPTDAIVLSGSGTSRSLSVSPVAGQTGSATITITVSDDQLSAADSFVLAVKWYTMFLPFAKR
jgi:uncharacterized repeat protein (TIGR01451 family)